MKVGIVGGRNFNDFKYMKEKLAEWQATMDVKITTVVSGGAEGADTLAKDWSNKYLGKKPIEFLPDKETHGGNAYRVRNTKIVNESEHIIAFPDSNSRGTWMTIRIAQKKGVPFTIYQKSKK